MATSELARQEYEGSVYWTGGTGEETLVLLHGTNDHSATWAPVLSTLSRHYRIIAPDLAGHGESEPRIGSIPIPTIVERVAAILDRENTRDVVLLGNSLGAWIAILYTLAHPARVKRLYLEAGGGLALPFGVPLVARDRETALIILRAVHGPSYVPQEKAVDALLARAVEAPLLRLTQLEEHLIDARVGAVTAPTTLIWGEHDGVLPLTYARALQQKIAGAKLQIIENAAHIPHLQQPQRFIACLTATS